MYTWFSALLLFNKQIITSKDNIMLCAKQINTGENIWLILVY